MARKYDVICIGSATVDHYVSMRGSISTIKKGVKVLTHNYMRHSGGGASNVAAALSKWGLKPAIIAKIGKYEDAGFILDELKHYKVPLLNKKRSVHHSDNSTIVCSVKDKDRVIFVHKDASSDLGPEDVSKEALMRTKWIYLSTLVGKSHNTMKKLMPFVKRNKINLLFNPSSYLAKQGVRKLKPFLSASKVIILNKEEAQVLLKDKRSGEAKLLEKLHKLGPDVVVITNCDKSLYAYDGTQHYRLKPPKVKVCDTSGAGDSFNAGFLAAYLKGYSVEECLQFGQALASSVIQHRGTKHKLLNHTAAKRAVKRHKITVQKKK